jgi:hypothetical protein
MSKSRPYRSGSVYGDGHRVPMCRERRAQWKARVVMFRRAGKLTPLHEDIGLAMLRRLGADGRLDPSQATIADDAGGSDRTVRRALERMQACGLVRWTRRITRDGWRCAQTSNAYLLTLGDAPAIPGIPCGGQAGRQTTKLEIHTVPAVPVASVAEIAAAQEALAARRRTVEGRLLNKGSR